LPTSPSRSRKGVTPPAFSFDPNQSIPRVVIVKQCCQQAVSLLDLLSRPKSRSPWSAPERHLVSSTLPNVLASHSVKKEEKEEALLGTKDNLCAKAA
jgi:hypothetical protein